MKNNRIDAFLRNEKKGFTLVEILVVVAILAILMAMIIPNYLKGRPQRLLNAQANKIAQVVRFGRLQAIRDNEKYYMEFIPELDMYRLWSPGGWMAYADPLRLRGDWDGDGLTFWADNDPDDAILDPRLPENKPIYTISPMLYDPDPGDGVLEVDRDFDNRNFEGDQVVFPHEVDLRMDPMSWVPGTTDIFARPDWDANDGVDILSRAPLLFLVFFPDGSVSSSWQVNQPLAGMADEVRDLPGGELGVTEIFLQVRGDRNVKAHDLYDDVTGGNPDGSSEINVSHWNTLTYAQATEESFGRRVVINHASGRVKVENFSPIFLDWDSGDPPNELIFF